MQRVGGLQRLIGSLLVLLAVGFGPYVYSLRPPSSLTDIAIRFSHSESFFIPEPYIYYIFALLLVTLIIGAILLFAPTSAVPQTLFYSGASLLNAYLLALVAAILIITPLVGTTSVHENGIPIIRIVTGGNFIDGTINCWMSGKFSIFGDCAPRGGAKGFAILIGVFASAFGAALGFIGLLPVIGRLTGASTMMAGLVVIGGSVFFILAMLGAGDGGSSVQWGAYLAVAGGLIALISGLSGMRGR